MERKIFSIFLLLFILHYVLSGMAISEERRNPFKDWFPVKIEEKPVVVEEVIIAPVEEEAYFNPSIYTVEGLFWGAVKPKAIINGQIYNLGDKLEEAEIVKIDKEGVTVVFEEQEYVITTNPVIKLKDTYSNVTSGNE